MDIKNTKECIKCHKIKELSDFSIREYPNGNKYPRGECKECCKIRQEKYHKEHKEDIKKWHSEYYQNNKKELKVKNNEWWDKNRDKMNEHRKKNRNKKLTSSPTINQINNEDIYKVWI